MTRKKFVRFKKVSCSALNVRNNPLADAPATEIIVRGTIVECDKNFKDDEWDHIITDPNIEGYCMKKFLEPFDPDKTTESESTPSIIHSHNYSCGSGDTEKEKKNGSKEKN